MADWEQKRSEAVDLALEAGFGTADAGVLARAARPALRLLAVPGAAEVAASKLGGLPDLPPGAEWPRGQYGPMTFCGQVRTRDASDLEGVDDWKPDDVLLGFFADKDPQSDDVQSGCVFVSEPDDVVRREPPPELDRGPSLIDESRFDATPVLTPPMQIGGPTGVELEHDFDKDDWGAWSRFYELLGCGDPTITAGHHQLLGHPWEVGWMDPVWMGGVRLATPDEDPDDEDSPFRLLAQFTTDQEANVGFADAGVVYFVIRAADLASGVYDRVAVFMESC